MHLYKRNRKVIKKSVLVAVALFIVIFIYFASAFSKTLNSLESGQTDTLKKAIDNAVASCYALEGAYPSDLAYLEEHYGLIIDYEKYDVDYDMFASNIKPNVTVYLRGGN